MKTQDKAAAIVRGIMHDAAERAARERDMARKCAEFEHTMAELHPENATAAQRTTIASAHAAAQELALEALTTLAAYVDTYADHVVAMLNASDDNGGTDE